MTTFQSQKRPSTTFSPIQTEPASAACAAGQPCLPTHDQIARRAHEIYVANGRSEGHRERDWCEATQQLAAYDAVAAVAQSHLHPKAL